MRAFPRPPLRALLLATAAMSCLAAAPSSAMAADTTRLGCTDAMPAGAIEGPAWQAEILRMVNQHRASVGRSALQVDGRLVRTANWKARDMTARLSVYRASDLGAHDDPGIDGGPGRTMHQRAITCGYSNGYYRENLLEGILDARTTPREVVNWWLNSPGHRATMEDPSMRYAGVGLAERVERNANGEKLFAVALSFGDSPSLATPFCSGAWINVPAGGRVIIDRHLCRTGGSPTLYGAAPTRGTLVGLRYAAGRRLGFDRFRVRWADTGVTESVLVNVVAARAYALLRAPLCSRAGRCTVAWTLRRPASPRSAAVLQVQRRSGRSWRTSRTIALPAGTARSGRTTVALTRGTWRMRIVIARHPVQTGAVSVWRTVRR